MTLAGWIFLGIATLGAVAAAGMALWSVNRALSMEDRLREDASAALAKGKADFASLAESVEDMIEEARAAKRRADGARGGRPPKTRPGDEPPNGAEHWTVDSYRAYVERTGRAIPAVEQALGL